MVKHELQPDMEFKGDQPVSPDVAAGFGFPLNYEDRQLVWEEVKRMHPKEWEGMDHRQKNKLAAQQLVNIIQELKAMNGGVWDMASSAEKRMLFRARFVGRGVEVRREERPDVKKPSFPSLQEWTKQNESMLQGTTEGERKQLYQRALAKAGKS